MTGNERLPVVLGAIMVAVAVFAIGYGAGKQYGDRIAMEESATELVEGIYAGGDADDPAAQSEVIAVEKESGSVGDIQIEVVDRYVGLIVTRVKRNGKLYRETITLEGNRLQSFSSMPVIND